MADITVYAEASDGYIQSGPETSYAAARNGSGTLGAVTATAFLIIGQRDNDGDITVHEAFLNYDVSALAGATISAATLSIWPTIDGSTTEFTIEARARDWGDALTTADFVPGGDLSGLTLLASLTTVGLSTGAYNALTSEAALIAAIESALAGDGILRLMICSSRTTNNNAPTGLEQVTFSSTDEASTTQDPKLDITYTEPASFVNANGCV